MPTIPAPPIRSVWFIPDALGRPRVRDIEIRFCMTFAHWRREELERLVASQFQYQARRAMELHPADPAYSGLLADVVKTAKTVLEGRHGIGFRTDPLGGVFEALVRASCGELEDETTQFDGVNDDARSRYVAAVLEARDDANHRLRQGMGAGEHERGGEFDAALRLLNMVAWDVNGGGDCSLWFQIGWLRWYYAEDLPSAENAFMRAIEVGSDAGGQFVLSALRHLAHIRYLRGDVASAWEAMVEATAICDDLGARYDRARYASVLGRNDDAEEHLLGCLKERPAMFVTMLSEEDFCCDA
jgi:hypothetical protein